MDIPLAAGWLPYLLVRSSPCLSGHFAFPYIVLVFFFQSVFKLVPRLPTGFVAQAGIPQAVVGSTGFLECLSFVAVAIQYDLFILVLPFTSHHLSHSGESVATLFGIYIPYINQQHKTL
mgnify:FL=1